MSLCNYAIVITCTHCAIVIMQFLSLCIMQIFCTHFLNTTLFHRKEWDKARNCCPVGHVYHEVTKKKEEINIAKTGNKKVCHTLAVPTLHTKYAVPHHKVRRATPQCATVKQGAPSFKEMSYASQQNAPCFTIALYHAVLRHCAQQYNSARHPSKECTKL